MAASHASFLSDYLEMWKESRSSQQKRLDLLMLQSKGQGLGQPVEIRHQTGGLLLGIILPKGDEEIMLAA